MSLTHDHKFEPNPSPICNLFPAKEQTNSSIQELVIGWMWITINDLWWILFVILWTSTFYLFIYFGQWTSSPWLWIGHVECDLGMQTFLISLNKWYTKATMTTERDITHPNVSHYDCILTTLLNLIDFATIIIKKEGEMISDVEILNIVNTKLNKFC